MTKSVHEHHMLRQRFAYSPAGLFSHLRTGLLLCAAMFAMQHADAAPYRAEWPQASSDLQPDPAVKFGTLPNGMRYAIMKNNMPAGAVSLRLRMDTGSLQENDAQQGIAHLLEHMAFRGSRHVPDGEVVKTLERIGLQFGADTNAFTSHTQTVYKFDLPRSDETSVDTGLMLLREIAGELNITDDALKTERGVVLSEWRLRNTPQQRADDAELNAMLPGQRAPLRMPIGKPDIIEKADAALVRSYYSAYYQPQRATLMVVGNIDPDALEKKIVARFGNWLAAAEIATDPALGTVKQPLQRAKIYAESGLPTQVSFDWSQPYDDSVTTRERVREDAIRAVGLIILNQHFQQAALSDDAPFSSARANYIENLMHSARCTSIGVDTTPEKWQSALQTVQRTLNMLLTQGVTQDDVQRVAATLSTNLQTAVTGANTRRTPSLADALVNSLDDREVFLSPQQIRDIAAATLQSLQAQTVTATLRSTFTGTGPLLFIVSSAPIAGGEAAVAAAYQDALNNAVADNIKQAPIIWPYTDSGTPGEIVSRQTVDDLGTTFVNFKNGVRAAIKPTQFSVGQLEVAVRVGTGRLTLDKRVATSNFLLNALVTGGLDKIDYPTLQKALAGKTYSLNAGLSDSYVLLNGRTTPGDLDTQLQVIAAYLTEPALRNGALEQMRNMMLAQLPQLSARPLSNLMVRVPGMLRDNDPRWTFPTPDEVRNAKADDLKAWLLPMLKQGALQIAIVGDIDVDRAVQTLAATVGALNTRPSPVLTLSKKNEITFPAATPAPLTLHHTGGQDQAAAFIAWPAPDRRSNLREAADLQVLAAIMQERLIDTMRSRTGSSYTANVFYEGAWALTGFGALQAVSDIKPAQTNVFYDAVNAIANDLRNKAVGKDEFSRAQQPLLANIDKTRQNNGFFAQVMVAPDFDPVSVEWLRKQAELIKSVTPERVQNAAKKYLRTNKTWSTSMLPTADGN